MVVSLPFSNIKHSMVLTLMLIINGGVNKRGRDGKLVYLAMQLREGVRGIS